MTTFKSGVGNVASAVMPGPGPGPVSLVGFDEKNYFIFRLLGMTAVTMASARKTRVSRCFTLTGQAELNVGVTRRTGAPEKILKRPNIELALRQREKVTPASHLAKTWPPLSTLWIWWIVLTRCVGPDTVRDLPWPP